MNTPTFATPLPRARVIAGSVITGLLAALLSVSAAMKFVAPPMVVEGFTKYGLADFRLLIACGEVACVLLLVFPRTFGFGVLMTSGYLGGAVVTHMSHGEPFVMPSICLWVLWLAAWLRRPWMFAARV